MELKELAGKFTEIVGCEREKLVFAIQEKLFSSEKNEILAKYAELINGDLATDELQRIYQYYFADRKEKCQDFTPQSLAKLCAKLTSTSKNCVYDLCAGSGAMTIQKWVQSPEKEFLCEELDENVIPFLLFNMAVRNMTGYVIRRDALTLETYAVYRLEKGRLFSEITKQKSAPEICASEIISNPPYNIRWNAPKPLFADNRFTEIGIPPASNANWAFILTALFRLENLGRCAFILPCGVLAAENEKEIRERMIGSAMLERVILLPDRMFESTSIPVCIMVFSHNNCTVKFYDCRKMGVEQKREQKGQFGGVSHENRSYIKTVHVLPNEIMDRLCGECEDIPGFSREIPVSQISENEFILTPTKYIKYIQEEVSHRPYADIISDINRISREKSAIKITCNENIAKKLGLEEAARLMNFDNPQELDKVFKILGGAYESRRFITLSKNKNEFKIENQDKERLSSLITFFLPMWKQHLFYLNQEENRLLAELRDAALPDLMSGKIEVAYDKPSKNIHDGKDGQHE